MASSLRCAAGLSLLAAACSVAPVATERIDAPFAPSGDAVRGREVFVSREAGHCALCHAVPGAQAAANVGPPLAGAGARFSPAELRFRVAAATPVNPAPATP